MSTGTEVQSSPAEPERTVERFTDGVRADRTVADQRGIEERNEDMEPEVVRPVEEHVIDMTNESWAGPSLAERALYAHLTTHIATERGLLEEYREIAESSQSNAFRYLVNLLIEDEIRHHRIFSDLAESLETTALMKAKEPIIPFMDFGQDDPEAVIAATQRLLRHENEDARELKRLQRELHSMGDDSLNGLLVELMQRDTQKHQAILRFVQKRAKRRHR
jgi:rubrerythrin